MCLAWTLRRNARPSYCITVTLNPGRIELRGRERYVGPDGDLGVPVSKPQLLKDAVLEVLEAPKKTVPMRFRESQEQPPRPSTAELLRDIRDRLD